MTELNQVHEVETNDEVVISADDNENLFDDYEVEEDTPVETTEESEESSETEVEDTPQQEVDSFLRIKYNGEEMSLNEDDARTLAQKGMNYDRFYEPIERLARMNGLSVGDYLNKLNDTQIQYEVSQEVENLREDPKYDGVSDEVLEEIANNRVLEQDKVILEGRKKLSMTIQAFLFTNCIFSLVMVLIL